ncbi:hypothetical protein KCV87_09020 [Actinosynnema pretiosum subsp. pretiosum]|uniref:Uncharacterized protein n=1 Tax=Actinosynnema pretiosum subsp. pretiosum TaxID=103721 RepID=A0AA45LAT0_9PSEU|nr:hypothetical protein KCV87_09020 [Actinosynnema pretiosum subsp. pretiosum]
MLQQGDDVVPQPLAGLPHLGLLDPLPVGAQPVRRGPLVQERDQRRTGLAVGQPDQAVGGGVQVPVEVAGRGVRGRLRQRAGTRPDHLDVADQLARETAGEHVGQRGELLGQVHHPPVEQGPGLREVQVVEPDDHVEGAVERAARAHRGQLEVCERVVGDGDQEEAVVDGEDGLDLVEEPLGLLGVADAVQLVHAHDDPPAVGRQHLGGLAQEAAELVHQLGVAERDVVVLDRALALDRPLDAEREIAAGLALGGGGAQVAQAVAVPAGEHAQLGRGEAVSGAAR